MQEFTNDSDNDAVTFALPECPAEGTAFTFSVWKPQTVRIRATSGIEWEPKIGQFTILYDPERKSERLPKGWRALWSKRLSRKLPAGWHLIEWSQG